MWRQHVPLKFYMTSHPRRQSGHHLDFLNLTDVSMLLFTPMKYLFSLMLLCLEDYNLAFPSCIDRLVHVFHGTQPVEVLMAVDVTVAKASNQPACLAWCLHWARLHGCLDSVASAPFAK
jgi:hypothetical protein